MARIVQNMARRCARLVAALLLLPLAALPVAAAGPPPMPTGLHATGAGSTWVTFGWTNGDPAASIAVSDGTTATPLPPGTTVFGRTGIPLGGYVCLSVSAWNDSGSSAWSPWSCSAVYPLTPTGLRVSGATETSVTFAWKVADPFSAIVLSIATPSGIVGKTFPPGTESYTQTGVAPGYWVGIEVAAYNWSYAGAFTNWAQGWAPPATPTNVHVTGHSTDSVAFAWMVSDPYSGIAVSNGTAQIFVGTAGTTYWQGGMTAGSWVCISTVALGRDGMLMSGWSSWVCGQAG